MTETRCERFGLEDLADYAAGDLPATEAAALEEHLFGCGDCAARAGEVDALARGLAAAVRTSQVGGFVTDAVLNRLARDGVRVRSFSLTPGAIVPCAVWEDDELMVLRIRGDFGAGRALTMTQHAGEREIVHATTEVAGEQAGEVLYAVPAAWVRELPIVEVAVRLSAHEAGTERELGSYTLVHGGVLRR